MQNRFRFGASDQAHRFDTAFVVRLRESQRVADRIATVFHKEEHQFPRESEKFAAPELFVREEGVARDLRVRQVEDDAAPGVAQRRALKRHIIALKRLLRIKALDPAFGDEKMTVSWTSTMDGQGERLPAAEHDAIDVCVAPRAVEQHLIVLVRRIEVWPRDRRENGSLQVNRRSRRFCVCCSHRRRGRQQMRRTCQAAEQAEHSASAAAAHHPANHRNWIADFQERCLLARHLEQQVLLEQEVRLCEQRRAALVLWQRHLWELCNNKV